ncbi:hypothetical protein ACI6Q2_14365 [Chitinophagaceae bacterium LWZ2-11]
MQKSYCLIMFVCLLSVQIRKAQAQTTIDQNGFKTTVTNALSANDAVPLRYEIADVGFNSFHWQVGGTIIIELFHQFWATGYEKYLVEVGFTQGANSGTPKLKLIASNGAVHNARIILGSTSDLATSYSGYVNKLLPIYLDVREYSAYRVKISYLHDKVDNVTDINQIKINVALTGTPVSDFTVNTIIDDITSFEIQSGLTNINDRPAVSSGTGMGEIRGRGLMSSSTDDGFLRLSAGGGTTIGAKSYIDISGYMDNPAADRYQNIVMGTNGQERVRINTVGNVGIGTTNPSEKLSVNGNIRSKKLIVTQQGWPDYVFDSSYTLTPLAQVEQFIKNNKHLPDVPSAKEVTDKGLDVGDNQAVLLKKIEELTLYMIEHDKQMKAENDKLRNENDEIKKRLQKLEQKSR